MKKLCNKLSKITLLNIAIATLLSLLGSAQEVQARTDSVTVWRFVYEGFDVNFKDRANDLLSLDVRSDGSSFFYSVYDVAGNNARTPKSRGGKSAFETGSSQTTAKYRIIRENNEIVCVTDAPDNFYYKQADQSIDWQITDRDTMTVCGYVCKKATASYAGRNWTAWFAEDLPISCGPWKLSGLPGLILSAYDSDNYFKFTCVGMEQVSILPWKIDSKGYIKCTNEEYQKQLRLFADDPVNYILRKEGLPPLSASETIIDDNGRQSTSLPKFDDMIYMEKISEDEK